MKLTHFSMLSVGLMLILAGCIQTPPEPTTPTPTTPPETNALTRTYAVSTADKLTYCNGADMDSAGYAATFTKKNTLTVTSTVPETAMAEVLKVATKNICKDELLASLSYIIKDGKLYVSPYDGWAGVSIHDCACHPAIEQTALLQPGITAVAWPDQATWDSLKK